MEENVLTDMKEQAYFVAGLHPWDRDISDLSVKYSLEDAIQVLENIGDSMDYPLVSGGTTSNPQVILTLSWLAESTDQSAGIHLRFYSNRYCEIICIHPDRKQTRKVGLSVADVIDFNIPYQYMKINEQSRPYRFDFPIP